MDIFVSLLPVIVLTAGVLICILTIYVDGSAVDFDKIVISDYSTDKIHINDELKEIYISK